MVDPGVIFINSAHIKASANKKPFQEEQGGKAAKVYSGQQCEEVNAEMATLGKESIEEDEDDDGWSRPPTALSKRPCPKWALTAGCL